MNCSCMIGGPRCGVCQVREANAKRSAERHADHQRQILALAARVVTLEETVLAQATIINELVEHMRSKP